MPLHRTSPVSGTVHLQNQFAADGCRIEQKIRPHQSHTSGRFRKPLIPADSNADITISGIPYLESGISRREIKLFLIIMIIRNMRLAINPEKFSTIKNGHGVVKHIPVFFKKADRHHNLKLLCHLQKMLYCSIFHNRLCIGIIFIPAFLTEILPFKQFRQKDNLRIRLSDHFLRMCNILCRITAHFHLYCCHLYGTCCVMQCMLPPPIRISLVITGTTVLSGNSRCRIFTAVPSLISPNCGTSTAAFEI